MRITPRVSRFKLFVAMVGSICCWVARAEEPTPPVAMDETIKVSLFASEPQVATPIGATIDSQGRLMVIESNTHQRQASYKGPENDQIRIYEASSENGKADKITTYYEGKKLMMNLVAEKDGSTVVSSRNEIFRLSGVDDKGMAQTKTTLAHLETKTDYPHNGLHGLAIDPAGNIYFGLGENFGGDYTLIGADGAKLLDNRGSGAIFKMDSKGNGLTRISYGFWNPFGIGIDPAGNPWLVDNDPDGRPPCRLINAVPGGDYGFEWRFGRTGLHPLQAWDGELPGTLGMVAGVGEAPCAVMWFAGTREMLVTSWRDHQVEGYTITPRGAAFTATMRPILKGGPDFRPVGLAQKGNTVYVTDWASGSYPVHGKGRIWKVTLPEYAPSKIFEGHELQPTPQSQRAAALRKSTDVAELTAAMDDVDPAIGQAASYGLSQLPAIEKIEWNSLKTARQHIWLMEAMIWRGADLRPIINAALSDPDDRVRQMAVRGITEQNIQETKETLEKSVKAQVMSPRLLGMTMTAIEYLNGDKAAKLDPNKIKVVLIGRMNAQGASDDTKAGALHMLLATHPPIPLAEIKPMLQSKNPAVQIQAVKYLNDDVDPARFPLLAAIANDATVDKAVRAEAIDGLAGDAAAHVDELLQLAAGSDASLQAEALRSLRPVAATLTPEQLKKVDRVVNADVNAATLAARLFGVTEPAHPAETDIAAWQKIVDAAPGNAEAGRRIFFHPNSAGCYHCHMLEGRGRAIGPDLTMIGHSQTREHVLESILDPSREIAPLFTMWTITTKNGEKYDGMLLRRDGQSKEVYVDATGVEKTILEKDITDRKMRKESLMPTGLVQALTDQELRDLIALLTEKR